MSITENFEKVKKNIPNSVKIVAVSKTKPIEDIQELYRYGHKIFGENKVQELVYKKENLPNDIEWHMIGHLQSNKVKYIVPFISLIHSVDNFKLLKEINKRATKVNRIIDCLLEVHIAKEESKYGFREKELYEMLENKEFKELKNVRICGLMGIATNTDDKNQVRKEFQYLRELYESTRQKYFSDKPYFKELSMGMTADYMIAIEEGATIVRIGSAIFGPRNYQK